MHANVPEGCAWDEFAEALEGDVRDAQSCAVWSRREPLAGVRAPRGVRLAVHGHTPKPTVEHRAGRLWVDTGAVYGTRARPRQLTMTEVQGREVSVHSIIAPLGGAMG